MAMMQAFRLLDWGKADYDQVPVPTPGPGELLVRVGGAGLCGSDVHFLHAPPGGWPAPPPWTLGHENAGWVERCGSGTNKFNEGDAVIATGAHSCGKCRACIRGDDNLCPHIYDGRGMGADGGLAQFVVVPERELVGLGELDPRLAAPLADAGHNTYNGVRGALPKLTPDATALVIGVGGLGSFAIQYLKLLSPARVIAAEVTEPRRSHAIELGADHALESDNSLADAVMELTDGNGADVVFDYVFNRASVATALACAAAGGSILLAGHAEDVSVQLSFAQSPRAGCQLYWNVGGNLQDLHEVVALAQRGLLRIDTDPVAFDRIPQAFARLERGEFIGRAVALPNG